MSVTNRAIVASLVLLSGFYLISGIVLFFFSQHIFNTLPEYYGLFNNHFVKDAGIAFLCSGIMLVLAVFDAARRFIYSFCASLFVVLHALFHVHMIFSGMVPGAYLGYELLQVIAPAFFLLLLLCVIYFKAAE